MKKINVIRLSIVTLFLIDVLTVKPMLTRSSQAARAAQRTRARVTRPKFYQKFKQDELGRNESALDNPIATSSFSTSPFGRAGQRRYYSTIPNKSTSWWDKITSLFQEKLLTVEEIEKLLAGHIDKEWKNSWGDKVGRMVFDEKDLEIAEEKLGKMIEKYPEYTTSIIEKYKYYFNFSGHRSPDLTVLDKAFFFLFNGDKNNFSIVTMTPSNSSLNYIKLITYLISKGAQINPENYDMYQQAYLQTLTRSYEQLYSSNPRTVYGIEFEMQKFKEIFKELDPILEQLLPGFGHELKKAQQERAKIETNPQEYKKKMQEEDRSKYMWQKADKMSRNHNMRARDAYASYPNEFLDKVQFNETEYQEWLVSGKDQNFFYRDRQKGYADFGFEGADYEKEALEEEQKSIWDLISGLTAQSSEKEVSLAYRTFMLKNHPDRLPKNLTKAKREELLKSVKEVNDAFDRYKEQLKKRAASE